MEILEIIERSKKKLLIEGVEPRVIYLSRESHDLLAEELGKKGSMIFEVRGLTVIIDPECPPMAAYIMAKEGLI